MKIQDHLPLNPMHLIFCQNLCHLHPRPSHHPKCRRRQHHLLPPSHLHLPHMLACLLLQELILSHQLFLFHLLFLHLPEAEGGGEDEEAEAEVVGVCEEGPRPRRSEIPHYRQRHLLLKSLPYFKLHRIATLMAMHLQKHSPRE